MDCGSACLGMLIQYYGKKPDMGVVRQACDTGKRGISLLTLSRAAESFGFRSLGGTLDFQALCTKRVLPCIAHWDQNHFVLVYRAKKLRNGTYRVYVADPGRGLVEYEGQEFCNHWISTKYNGKEVGVILLAGPTQAFYEHAASSTARKPKRRLAFLWGYAKAYRRYFGQLLLGLLVGSLIQLVFPFLTQLIVDAGIGGRDLGFIWLILLAELMLIFSQTAVEFVRSSLLLHISTRINIALISDFFIKLMKLPMRFFDSKQLGDLLQRIEDHRRVEQFLTSSSLTVAFSFFTFLIFGLVLLWYNWLIFIVFLLATALYSLWIVLFLRKRRRIDYAQFEQGGRNRNVTFQLLQGMQEIKLQGCQQRKRWEWEDVQADGFQVNRRALNLQQLQRAGSVTINEVKNILITVLAASSVIQGEMTIGMMLAVQYVIGQLNGPVEQLINFIYSWQDVRLSLERMQEIHQEAEEEDEHRTCRGLPAGVAPDLMVEGLEFRYEKYDLKPVLHDITLRIPAGQVTAIVGPSGSGKTTLVKLLLGFYEPREGTVKVAGVNLRDCSLAWWRDQCGAVMQEGYLFSDTIARNIAVGDYEIDLERVRAAARVACIADYVEALPLAYNTMIGADGQGISQGQRQRILIARVVYKNPQFVFLDEATNSLDARNERAIVENLRGFYRGKTVLVVAHRLSTVRDADQIVVLDKGHIVEQGTHEQLIAAKGSYFELVRNQLELGT